MGSPNQLIAVDVNVQKAKGVASRTESVVSLTKPLTTQPR